MTTSDGVTAPLTATNGRYYDLTFQPGRMGMLTGDWNWGRVGKFEEGSQAERLGVKPGLIMTVNGAAYTHALVLEAQDSGKPYTVEFFEPEDAIKMRFSHDYKDALIKVVGWSTVVLAITGGVALVGAYMARDGDCPSHLPTRVRLNGCGMLASAVLFGILYFLAVNDRRQPFNAVVTACAGVSICFNICLAGSCAGLFSSKCSHGLLLINIGIDMVIGGIIGVFCICWLILGMRARLGMDFYSP
eukprot:TRINITY_DN45825_c0_g1_i1.p1 TRINITY_DN45825_c0_g1~~TRINITY_DN45825_c0_g1_i1.p1  ORF type:complete len:273 (-),score=26.62 TRINITY_DN45825_c0_g1_i1:205-939(-)